MDSTLDKQESESNKKEDPEYIEEEDHLNLFPPLSYRKGDISLGVLMSGWVLAFCFDSWEVEWGV